MNLPICKIDLIYCTSNIPSHLKTNTGSYLNESINQLLTSSNSSSISGSVW
jgi:hypothetical protein